MSRDSTRMRLAKSMLKRVGFAESGAGAGAVWRQQHQVVRDAWLAVADAVIEDLVEKGLELREKPDAGPVIDVEVSTDFRSGQSRLRHLLPDEKTVMTEGHRITYYGVPDGPKMLRETLCVAQARIGASELDQGRKREHLDRLQHLIDACDAHRPIGPDGKHNAREGSDG